MAVSPQIFLMVSPFGCANAAGVVAVVMKPVVSDANARRLSVPNIKLVLVVKIDFIFLSESYLI
jgi:hypothetical protein